LVSNFPVLVCCSKKNLATLLKVVYDEAKIRLLIAKVRKYIIIANPSKNVFTRFAYLPVAK
jgi:hypothetical protein